MSSKEPWEYPIDALNTLCESCHSNEYESRPEAEQQVLLALRVKGFCAADVQDFAIGFFNMQLLHLPEVVASVYEWALKTPEIQQQLIDQYFRYLEERGITWDKELGSRKE